MIDVSVVIVNYNVRDLVIICLNTLYKYLPASIIIETILVDNNSSDNSIEAISEQFPQVKIIANKFNAGFPAANNQAFHIAKGKYIFMLNPDTEFFDDALSKMVEYMENHREISMMGPRLLNSDKTLQQSFWRYPTLTYLFFDTIYLKQFIGSKYYRDKNVNEPFEAESFSGAAILFQRELLQKIGFLDEKLFWIEEIDYCYRAHLKGLKLLYYPPAVILHHIGQSAKKNYNIAICNQVVNKIKFFKKYHSTFEWILVVLLSFIHVVFKLVVFGLLALFKRIYYLKAKAYLYTLPRVFNPPTKMN